MAGDRAGALAHINDDEILTRIRAGEHAIHIAQELGVHQSALYHRYAENPQYKVARRLGARVRLDGVEQEIAAAPDPFTLARAREKFRALAWRCEREFPDEWGQRTHVTVEQVGDLAEKLRRARERTIDGEVVSSDPIQTSALSNTPDESKT